MQLEWTGRAGSYTDEPGPWRHLACALLLEGALGAYARDGEDIDWIAGDESRILADLVGLAQWPPRWGQLVGLRELKRRARDGRGEVIPFGEMYPKLREVPKQPGREDWRAFDTRSVRRPRPG